jgi:ABC-type amino acid transport substrate-binding protein
VTNAYAELESKSEWDFSNEILAPCSSIDTARSDCLRSPTSFTDVALDLPRTGKADAFAFPRYILLDYSEELPGSRVLPGAYGVNRVKIAIPMGQAGWVEYVSEFIEEAKKSGLIHSACHRARQRAQS